MSEIIQSKPSIYTERENERLMTTKKYNSIFLFALLTIALALVGWPVAPSSAPVQAANLGPLPNVTQIAAGYEHTCALTTTGGVKCWGNNYDGQLGIGNPDVYKKTIPVDVIGLNSNVVALSAGEDHTCALTTTGGVKCWGDNYFGELGDGTTVDKDTPIDVSGLTTGVTALSAGRSHTCVLTIAGGVKCWGRNNEHQLGDGTNTDRKTPVDVTGLSSGIVAITGGGTHTCALTATSGVKCWGENNKGQLGDGTDIYKSTPVDVSELSSGVTAVTTGDSHTCVLTTSGSAKCWGANDQGQLGDGTNVNKNTPVAVNTLTNGVKALTAGVNHTCALMTTGSVKCWGQNQYGRLGDGTNISRNSPVDVSGLNTAAALSAGNAHTCAVTTTGGVKCWGYNGAGQVGDGTEINKNVPVDVSGLSSGITAISAGSSGGTNHACALTTTGGVKCWGWNGSGQVGDGTNDDKKIPTDVSGLTSGITAISAGGGHTCALTTAGGVKCWGFNEYGAVGDATNINKNTPVDVTGLTSGITAISAGGNHTCVVTTAGGVKCWGDNGLGALGNGTDVSANMPVDVNGLSSGVTAVSAGKRHTCALTATGGVKCWGYNFDGQLGDGTNVNKNSPVDVSGLSNGVKAISVGGGHSCALTTAGGVKCWGLNNTGELGNGSYNAQNRPVSVNGLSSGVVAITAGEYHTCALTTVGGVKCWGGNSFGGLGDGTDETKNTPIAVQGLSNGVAAISAGGGYTCALSTTGGVKCWGNNSDGQLGDGDAWRTTPVDVVEAELTTLTPTTTPTATPATPGATVTPTPTAEPTVVTARVEGKVLDQETQTGIADVLLMLSSANRHTTTASALMGDATVYTATTGFDGAFVFPAVRLGTYTLSGAKAGVVIQSPAPLVISSSETVPIAPLQATKASAMLYLPLVTKR